MNGLPYFVNGTSLYRLNTSVVDRETVFTREVLGDIEGTARPSMADNGRQLCILVPGGKGYIFTTGPDTLTEITDSDFRTNGEPQQVVFIDGYFVFTTDSKRFIISALNDGLSYNGTDFGTAEADPDDIVAPLVIKNQLMIAGSQTIEAFQNRPSGADFPFVRTGLFIQKGVSAASTIVAADNTFMFIGAGENESPAIWQFTGSDVVKVSSTAIDTVLRKEDISGAFAWSYAEAGAYFVGFTLQSTTLVIDTVNHRWHERRSTYIDDLQATQTVRFRANSFVQAYDRVFCNDSLGGKIGELTLDVYTEYGNNIRRIVSTQPFQESMQSFTLPMVELTVESGVGNDAVPDPVMSMSISRDGKEFGVERLQPIGRVGETTTRVRWWQNGYIPRFCILRFTLTDAIKPVIIQLTMEVDMP